MCIVRNKTAITNEKNDECLSKWETEAIDQTIYHTRTERHLVGQSYYFSRNKKWEGFGIQMACTLSCFGYSTWLQRVGVIYASLEHGFGHTRKSSYIYVGLFKFPLRRFNYLKKEFHIVDQLHEDVIHVYKQDRSVKRGLGPYYISDL